MIDKICSDSCSSIYTSFEDETSCFEKIAGTLTGDEIKKHGLVKGGDAEFPPKYQTTTVDLTVGDGHYIYDGLSTDEEKKWRLIYIGKIERLNELNNAHNDIDKYSVPDNKPRTLRIPAYGSAFVQLNEVIDTLDLAINESKSLMVVGRFDLKLSSVHQGLISQQATQIEPCYKGKLFCFIHNLSNKEAELNYGTRVATIEFSYVSCSGNKQEKKNLIDKLIEENKSKYAGPFCNKTGINDVRYFHYNNRLPDDCGLLSLKEDLENELKSPEVIKLLSEEVNKHVDKKAKWIPVLVGMISAFAIIFGVLFSN